MRILLVCQILEPKAVFLGLVQIQQAASLVLLAQQEVKQRSTGHSNDIAGIEVSLVARNKTSGILTKR